MSAEESAGYTWEKLLDRLYSFTELQPGWNGEGSVGPTDEFVREVHAFLVRIVGRGLPLPHVYPTLGGGVQLEWDRPDDTVSLDCIPHKDDSSQIGVFDGICTSGCLDVTEPGTSYACVVDWLEDIWGTQA